MRHAGHQHERPGIRHTRQAMHRVSPAVCATSRREGSDTGAGSPGSPKFRSLLRGAAEGAAALSSGARSPCTCFLRTALVGLDDPKAPTNSRPCLAMGCPAPLTLRRAGLPAVTPSDEPRLQRKGRRGPIRSAKHIDGRTAPALRSNLGFCTWVSVLGFLYLGFCTWVSVLGFLYLGFCTWVSVLGFLYLGFCTWVSWVSCTWVSCTWVSCTWVSCTWVSCTWVSCTWVSCTWVSCTWVSCTWVSCTWVSVLGFLVLGVLYLGFCTWGSVLGGSVLGVGRWLGQRYSPVRLMCAHPSGETWDRGAFFAEPLPELTRPRRPPRTGIRTGGAVRQDARAGSRTAPRRRRGWPTATRRCPNCAARHQPGDALHVRVGPQGQLREQGQKVLAS